MNRYRQTCLVLACAVLLVGCGEVVEMPASQTQSVPTTVVPTLAPQAQTAPADVTARLQEQLRADKVLVNTVTLGPGNPAVLTIDYQFNDHNVANAQVGVETAIIVETDRVVQMVSKRVVEQVEAGAKIDRVVMHMHLGQGDTPDTRRINVADMQAWSAGQLNDADYRARWCCDTAPDVVAPVGYPGPGAGPAGAYPAPGSGGTVAPTK